MLLIDLWKYLDDGRPRESPEVEHLVNTEMFNNVFQILGKFDILGLSSTYCINETKGKSVWYSETDLTLPNYKEFLEYLPHQQTFDYILDYKNENIKQLSIRHLSELTACIKRFNVDQIYLAGAAWELCMKDNEIGYDNIVEYYPEIELFVDPRLVSTVQQTFPNMSLEKNWEQVEEFLYRYKK